jgi:hypothetical protein
MALDEFPEVLSRIAFLAQPPDQVRDAPVLMAGPRDAKRVEEDLAAV